MMSGQVGDKATLVTSPIHKAGHGKFDGLEGTHMTRLSFISQVAAD